jgi:hypothetical protein
MLRARSQHFGDFSVDVHVSNGHERQDRETDDHDQDDAVAPSRGQGRSAERLVRHGLFLREAGRIAAK